MRKYKKYVLFLFIFINLNNLVVFSQTKPLYGKVIVIDPGHGGKDKGAYYNNTYESDLNLLVSLNLKKQIEKRGALVYMTRYDDYDLSNPKSFRRKKSDFDNRIKIINYINPDCVISIHMNASSNKNYNGLQIFYSKDDKLAYSINKFVNPKRKVKKINNIYFMDNINYPIALIEYGFISNTSDLEKINSYKYQFDINNKIINGITKYLKNNIN